MTLRDRLSRYGRRLLTGHADDSARGRRGLTLLEVIIALGIFAGSMAALSQLITTGLQAAVRSRYQTQAIFRCQSKMAEVVAGYDPMDTVTDAPFEDDANWTWSLESQVGPHDALLELVVTVVHNDDTGFASASFRLSRYIRDPQIFLDAAAAEEASEEM